MQYKSYKPTPVEVTQMKILGSNQRFNAILFYTVLLLQIFCPTTKAQLQIQQMLSSDKGLSSTLIGGIVQDRNGNLWIATENGLNKYNGVKLTNYYHDESDPHSLSSNYVRDIFEDRDGNLLIGTYAGLQVYDPATDSFSLAATYESGELFYNLINHIIQRKNGDILTSGNMLGKVTIAEDGHPVVSYLDVPIPTASIEEVFEDSKGRLWITKEASGVFRLDPDNSVHKYCTEVGSDPFCICIREDRKGNILAGTSKDGVLKYDPIADDFKPIGKEKFIARAFLVNNDEETFVCTDGKGLKCYNNVTGEITDYHFEVDFVESEKSKVHSVTKDSQGNLWLALYQHGALMIPAQKSSFKYFGSHSLSQDIIGRCCVTAVARGFDDSWYIGTDNDGLYIVDKTHTKSRHLSPENTPNIPPIIIGLFEDSEHNIWMGSYGYGASILSTKDWTCKKVEGIVESSGEPVSNVYDFVEDNDKRVWIATMGGGLRCYDLKTKKLTICSELNTLVNNWIGCIDYSPKTNSLLLGTYAGLWKIGLSNFGNNNEQTLASSIIYDIYEDSDNAIWAATSDGLARWESNGKGIEGSDLLLFTKEDGLPSNICYSVEGDDFERIWVSTGNGLVRMNRNSFNQIHYFVEDGIQGNEFSKNASTVDLETGDLYFGGVNGVTWFSPKEVSSNSKKWDVHISDMYIAGQPVTVGKKSGKKNIINQPVFEATDFYLSHNDNAFTLEIGTNDLSNSDKKIIYYSMNDDNWVALPKGIKQVSFSSLPPGNYTFKAKVLDGSIESDIKTVNIHIRPAWWQTWWAIILVVFLFGFFIYYIAEQIRHRRILRHKMFQHIQSERNSESKLQFLTNVSHEIRTPMTLIMNPLQQLINTDYDDSRQHSYRLMLRNANRIMSLVNQLMDVRKIEHGQLRMKMKETELGAYIENLTNTFEGIANSRNVALAFHKVGIEHLSAWIDEENFDKVLMNLLSNAMKYTPTGGSINIYLSKIENPSSGSPIDNAAEIIVSDSGVGIPESDLGKVFERFFQARNKKSGNGTGVGLHLTRSIVNLHHGTIKAENNPDGAPGCRFIVHIPLGNAHLTKDEMLENVTTIQETRTSAVIKEELNLLESEIKAENDAENPAVENDTKKTILVAEDDDEIRKYLKEQLSSKYKVFTCENGLEALDFIRKTTPKLVISDVMMPEMDGFSLCKKIRQNIQLNDLPIILLTAKTMNEDYIHGLELGADAYITKPFDIRILKQSITSLLKSRQTLKNIYSGTQSLEGKIEEIKAKTPDEKLLDKVMKVINDNISNSELSVEMIAEEVGVSRVHLHRKLRQLTNQTTRDLIRNQRITLAAKLLKEKKMPIAEVAYFVGFSSPAHFTTSFKSMYGMSPSQYTSQNSEDN